MNVAPSFWVRMRERKLVQWALVYVAGAWVALEVTAFLSDTFGWPAFVVRSLTVIAAVGFLAVLVLAWFHGERGYQRASTAELVLLAGLTALAVAGVAVLGPGEATAPEALPTGQDAGRASVAVLPFDNLGGDPADELFGEGVAEEIIAHLSRLDGLLVIARSSVMPYRGSAPQEVARALGVRHVLTGSVRRAGNRVRIQTDLVDPRSGAVIWGEQFDREFTDVFAIQSQIARAVAHALDVRVSDAQAAVIGRDQTTSQEAYDLYLQGREAWNRRTGEDIAVAVDYFRQAIEVDSGFANAWAGLADAYAILPSYTRVSEADAFPAGLAAADRALALDSTLAGPHIARAMMRVAEWPAPEVEAEFRRGLALSPGYATGHHWHGVWLISRGRFAEAAAAMAAAAERDPRSLVIATELGWPAYFAGRFDTALGAFRDALEIEPDYQLAAELTWGALELAGRYREAAAAGGRTVVLQGQPGPVGAELEARLLDAYEAGGAEGYWRERLAWLERLGRGATFLTSGAYTAGVQARAGDLDAAFVTLERAIDERDPFRRFFAVDPALAPLRGDPRFERLMERAGLADVAPET